MSLRSDFFSLLEMVFCNNCFLFDEFNFQSKIGFFESQKEVVSFMINVLMNIQKYVYGYCKCDGQTICFPCEIAKILDEKLTHKIYENCFNFDLLSKIKDNLCIQLINLQESQDHFLCEILNEKYKYHQEKCIFTGKPITISVREACREWEKIRMEKNMNQKLTVPVRDFLLILFFMQFYYW